MNEQIEKRFVDVTLCGWCGIPLGSANTVQGSVCVRCFELLTKANLTKEEIFASNNSRKETLLSDLNQSDEK